LKKKNLLANEDREEKEHDKIIIVIKEKNELMNIVPNSFGNNVIDFPKG
jgi:hypothetical protein